MTIHPQRTHIIYTLCVHIANTHTGLACETTGCLHTDSSNSFTLLLPSVKSGSATISIFRALLSHDHRDMSMGTTYAAILRPSGLVLGVPPNCYIKSENGGDWGRGIRNMFLPSPSSQGYSVPCFLASSLFTSVFHVLNNLPPGKYLIH